MKKILNLLKKIWLNEFKFIFCSENNFNLFIINNLNLKQFLKIRNLFNFYYNSK